MKKPYIKSVAVLAISLGLFSCGDSYKMSKAEEKKLEELEKRAPEGEDGVNAVLEAMDNGHLRVLEELLNLGCLSDIKPEGQTLLLMSAIAKGQTDAVKVLVSNGISVNLKVENYGSPLFVAMESPNSKEMVEILLEAGANANATDEKGRRPLFCSAARGNVEITKMLIDAGADVNYISRMGDVSASPISYAAGPGSSLETVKVLIDAGANMNAKPHPALLMASLFNNEEIVKVLIEAGADVNAKNEDGETALQPASSKGYLEVVKALLEAGADVNAKGDKGVTALMYAAESGHVEVVKTLIEAGCDVKAKSGNGKTALRFASRNGHVEVVKILRAAGAKE